MTLHSACKFYPAFRAEKLNDGEVLPAFASKGAANILEIIPAEDVRLS
jgi:hypothetical protein